MSDILPCPFCGSAPEIEPWHGGGPEKVMISCPNEGCPLEPRVTGETPDEAWARWNTRVLAEPRPLGLEPAFEFEHMGELLHIHPDQNVVVAYSLWDKADRLVQRGLMGGRPEPIDKCPVCGEAVWQMANRQQVRGLGVLKDAVRRFTGGKT